MNRLNAVFTNLVDGLCDPLRHRRAMLALAAAYGATWFAYGVVAKSSQDLNADLAEMTVWAHEPALGYPKHPPLLAYVIRAWFAVFPQADWAFTLLAARTLSAGLYLAFEVCGLWLDGEKRAAAPFHLGVIPFYNFLGLKFDQNSAPIPLWGLAMLAFMRSLETRPAAGQLSWDWPRQPPCWSSTGRSLCSPPWRSRFCSTGGAAPICDRARPGSALRYFSSSRCRT